MAAHRLRLGGAEQVVLEACTGCIHTHAVLLLGATAGITAGSFRHKKHCSSSALHAAAAATARLSGCSHDAAATPSRLVRACCCSSTLDTAVLLWTPTRATASGAVLPQLHRPGSGSSQQQLRPPKCPPLPPCPATRSLEGVLRLLPGRQLRQQSSLTTLPLATTPLRRPGSLQR